jgi:FkbM family methyltransferase
VISIEALRTTFALLQKNILLNNCSNVRAVNLAVSDRSHVLDFYLPPAHSLGTATTDPSRGMTERIQVEAKAIDEILSLDELKNLRLIKLDIEGGEIAVLRRLLSNLNAYPERLQILAEVSGVEHESGWPEIFQAMTKAGFLAYGIENSYDESWYLQWRHVSAPKLLLELPKQQTDVVFSRQPIGVGVADQG